MRLRRLAGRDAKARVPLALAAILACGMIPGVAGAADSPPPLAIGAEAGATPDRIPVAPRGSRGGDRAGQAGASGGWWLGTAGVGLALAAFGWAGLASRQLRPSGDEGTLKVLGRASLGAKQAVSLVQVGDRILIVGTGAQGAPSLLGEIDDEAEIRRFARASRRPEPSSPGVPARPAPRGGGA